MSITKNLGVLKTTNIWVNIITAVISGAVIFIILNLIFAQLSSIHYIVFLLPFLIACIVAPFTTSYITDDTTTFSITETQIKLITEKSIFYRASEKIINIDELNSFHIHRSKYFTHLIFYRKQDLPVTVLLGKNDETEIYQLEENFKQERIKSLSETKHLSKLTFGTAFKKLFLFQTKIILAVSFLFLIEIISFRYFSGQIPEINFWFIAAHGLILWLFFKSRLLKEFGNKIQYYTLVFICYIFTVVFLFGFGISPRAIDTALQTAITLTNINNLQNFKTIRFLKYKEPLINRRIIGFYQSSHRNSKSNKTTINNVFSVPIINQKSQPFDKAYYTYWISNSFEHTFKKASAEDLAKFKNDDFRKFKNEVDGNHEFFEIIHCKHLKNVKNKLSALSVESTWQYNEDVIILKPFNIPFKDYQSKEHLKLLWIGISFLVMIVVNSLIGAKSR